MAKPLKTPAKGVQSRYINLGFPTMIRKARGAATAASRNDWRGLDAIIYSALAVEAFVNDFGTMAALLEGKGRVPAVRIAAKALERAEKKRRPTMDKVIAVARWLSGSKPSKGAAPLQQLALLLDLRNHIVHSRADILDGQDRAAGIEALLVRVHAQGDLVPKNLRQLNDWRFMLDMSPGVALWALEVARAVALWINDLCPESEVKKHWLAGATSSRSAMYQDL
jgi:hypothetical protein